MVKKITSPFALGYRSATRYWGWLVGVDPEGVRQCIHLAIAQIPPDDIKELNRAVDRELYRLARELGWRQRSYRSGLNALGQQWERIIIPEGLVPKTSAEKRNHERLMRRNGQSLSGAESGYGLLGD